MVGLANGKIYAFNLFEKNVREGTSKIADKPLEAWNWQAAGVVKTRPLPAGKLVAFGATDGKAYVALSDERQMLYRIATGGAIGDGFGAHGTRLLLVPSADRNFYGVDLLTAQVLWSFPSGAAIEQAPLVAGDDIFIVNTAGSLFSIEPKGGTSKWMNSTLGGRLLAVGEKRIYLESHDDDLFIVDRASGQVVVSPHATFSRIGLNLREYQLAPTNYENDRLYFATTSGMVIAIRETGATAPRMLRDPKALPFGYIPPEGIPSSTVPVTPPAESPPAADKPADTPK
jgi:outer membrane protein assembly factor BamB